MIEIQNDTKTGRRKNKPGERSLPRERQHTYMRYRLITKLFNRKYIFNNYNDNIVKI